MSFKETNLWKSTLGLKGRNANERKALERLRTAFDGARERIKPLVRQAHIDCHGLTVHDETHLDALWETADLISGKGYKLNPVEAFVFGCAVLFHDSALSVWAYDGGLDGIKKTPEWRRAVDAFDKSEASELKYSQPADSIAKISLFQTLRHLHARQAIVLVDRTWAHPKTQSELKIIDDEGLLEFYGGSIGMIAASHHWDIERVAREFQEKGAMAEFPGEWALNEFKVAALLRCADAAHIDARRAPSFLYSITQPTGVSGDHWGFQNKLAKPTLGDRALIYTGHTLGS